MNLFDYEVLDEKDIMKVINKSEYARLGICNNNEPQVILMSFKYSNLNDELIFKLYSKESGTKIQYIKNNPNVCLEFEYETYDGVESVLLSGNAIIKDKDDQFDNLVEINIIAKKLSGRKYSYYKNHK